MPVSAGAACSSPSYIWNDLTTPQSNCGYFKDGVRVSRIVHRLLDLVVLGPRLACVRKLPTSQFE